MFADAIRLLLVEDNRGDAVLLQELLGDRADIFSITWVDNLARAVDLAAGESFDAVLLDLSLPDSSGLETLAAILGALPSAAIIVVTGLSDEAVALRAIRAGAQDYLVKDGLSGPTIIRSIRYSIDRKRAERGFRILSETGSRLLAAENPQSILEELCADVMRQLDCHIFFNYFVEEPDELADNAHVPRLRLNAFAGISREELGRIAVLDFGAGVCGRVARDGVRIVLDDIQNANEPGAETLKSLGVLAYCCHPLLAQGRVIGVLAFGTRTRRSFSGDDLAVMKTVSDQVATAMQRMLNLKEIERAKAEWERTFNSVPDLIAILDDRHRILRVNKAMARRLGRSEDECVGLHCYECVHNSSKPVTGCPQVMTIADGTEHVAEIHEERLDGDFLVSTSPLRDASGRMLGTVHVARDITERLRFEKQLAESERRYRNLFTHMSEGFALHEVLCDEQGNPVDYRFIDVNPGYEEMTGLSRSQLVGKRALEVLSGRERLWLEKFRSVALTGNPWRFEDSRSETGQWFEVYAYRPVEGQVAVILADVTEVARAREQERTAMATMTAARTAMDTLEAMGEGLVVTDRRGVIRSMNPAMVRLCGYGSGEAVGKSLAELLPRVVEEEDLPAAMRVFESAMKGNPVAVPPLTLVAKDGRRIAVAPALSFIRGPGGRTDGIVLTLRDISELRAAHRAVEESERKYRDLVENANSIIMRRRTDGTITFFNEYAQKFFGFPADEVLGHNVLGLIVPEVDSEGRDLAAMISEISAAPDLYANNENENVCRDGRRVWVHWTNKAVRDNKGNFSEILCVGSDVTERKLVEAENRRYQERLRSLAERLAASEEQDRWRISRYIHDTIVQNLSLSRIQLDSLAVSLANSHVTDEDGKIVRTRRLIDKAIDECRMVMSDLTPALLYELGLVAALNELATKLEAEHEVSVRIEDEGQDVPMEAGILGLLFQSARELIVNSLKHAGKCEVRVNVKREGNDVVITVADRGKGFDTTVVSSRPGQHGGFGLFSIRQRVEELGGRMEIDSVPGKGTKATIAVPVP